MLELPSQITAAQLLLRGQNRFVLGNAVADFGEFLQQLVEGELGSGDRVMQFGTASIWRVAEA